MPPKPKASGTGVYNKRIAGMGAGAIITNSAGEQVKKATDAEAQLRAQQLLEGLANSKERLTLEDFVKKHKDTMDDLAMSDNPEFRAQYRKQLDEDRRKRMKAMKKRRKNEESKKKSKKKKKKDKEKKKKKKKEKKKKKKKEKDSSDSDSEEEEEKSPDPPKKKQKTEESKSKESKESKESKIS